MISLDLAENRLASLQRAETERRRREEASRRKDLMGLERKDAKEFWGTVTLRDAELLVSDTRPGNWPVFTVKGWVVGEGYSRLHIAANRGNKDVVSLLLERGADIHARDSNQATPLHFAAGGRNKDVVSLLLERGADIHAHNSHQATPLHSAAFSGHEDVVRLLLERGADIDARMKSGHTALAIAKLQGKTGVVALLRAKLRQAGRR